MMLIGVYYQDIGFSLNDEWTEFTDTENWEKSTLLNKPAAMLTVKQC